MVDMPYTDPEAQKKYQRELLARRRAEWLAKNGPCTKCGSRDDLEVDHVDPTKKVSHNVWSWSEKRREEELAKCQVLCGTCHKAKTAEYLRAQAVHGTKTMRWNYGCECELCKEYVRETKRAQRERWGHN